VLTAARDASGRLLALLPVYVAVDRPLRVGRFLGHGVGDELGPICAIHDRAATADALHSLLRDARIDVMLAEQVPAAWGDLLDGRVLRREGSPILKLAGRNWDEVVGGFSANLRQQVRRFERRLEREHRLVFQLSGEDLEQDLDDLFRLHALRWSQEETGFATLQQAFQREFAAIAARQGWLRLWFLELDGCRVASWYGFRFGKVESYYQAGRDPAWEQKSVGFVLLAHSLRAAAEDGVDEYRFLRGGEHFKYRFADADPGLATVGVANGVIGATALLGAAAVPRSLHGSALLRLG
jgi:CelD/BcsL family acetyltransferase involved in cellulose biosynthesis